MANFQKGDVVYLKSGSEAMTITSDETSDGSVHVAWHTKDGAEKMGYYPRVALTKENPSKIPPEPIKQG